MIKDFSKNEKYILIKQIDSIAFSYNPVVSNPKRWYPYEKWIKELGIGACVKQVNGHHTEILEQCHHARKNVERVFENVSNIDDKYAHVIASREQEFDEIFQGIRKLRYYVGLRKKVDIFFSEYTRKYPGDTVSEIVNLSDEALDSGSNIASMFKKIESISEKTSLLSAFLGVGSANVKLMKSSFDDAFSNLLSSLEDSTDTELSLYKFYEKRFEKDPYLLCDLDHKFGSTMNKLKIGGSIVSFVNKGVEGFKRLRGDNVNLFDAGAVLSSIFGGAIKAGADIYTVAKTPAKSIVNTIIGTKYDEFGKEILDVKTTYAIDEVTKDKITKIDTTAKIVGVAFDTAEGLYDRASKIKNEKGYIDISTDCTEIGAGGAMSGLSGAISGITYGVVNIDAEETLDNMIVKVDEYVQGDNWCGKTIRDPNTPEIGRAALSIGGSVAIVTTEVVKGAGKAVVDAGKGLFNFGVAIGNNITSFAASKIAAKKADAAIKTNANVKQVEMNRVSMGGMGAR